MATKKSWLSLPFIGSSSRGQQQNASDHNGRHATRPTNGDGARDDANHQRTAAEVAKMKEEDVIADYNSPIHMCMSRLIEEPEYLLTLYEGVVSTLFPLIAGKLVRPVSLTERCSFSQVPLGRWRACSIYVQLRSPGGSL